MTEKTQRSECRRRDNVAKDREETTQLRTHGPAGDGVPVQCRAVGVVEDNLPVPGLRRVLRQAAGQMRCLSREGSGNTYGNGAVLAAKAVATPGKGSALAAMAVATHKATAAP